MDTPVQREEAKAKKEADADRALLVARIQDAYQTVLSLPEGITLLRYIIDKTGFFAENFTGNSKTYYLEGRASIGREMLSEIAVYNPKAFTKICVEGLRQQYEIMKKRRQK